MDKKSRTTLQTGSGPSSLSSLSESLSKCHPFVQQLDIVFPTHVPLKAELERLGMRYRKGRMELHKVFEAVCVLSGDYTMQRNLVALSVGSLDTEDVWCLDHYGILTLSLTKETYQQLGLVGQAQSKKSKDRYAVEINLRERQSKLFARAKAAARSWDERRKARGAGPWEVLYQGPFEAEKPLEVAVSASDSTLSDIFIPKIQLGVPEYAREDAAATQEVMENWRDKMAELFEWIGMVGFRSDRLKANDSVDPYVAVYEPPLPSRIGSVHHVRYRGFLTPPFTKDALGIILHCINSGSAVAPQAAFISVTANTIANAPVTYRESIHDRNTSCRSSIHCWSLLMNMRESDMEWVLATVETGS